jgi:ribonucleoside-diphosphate reductase alpha chain
MPTDHSIYGPKTRFAQEIHKTKFQSPGEDFYSSIIRQANALADNQEHFLKLKNIYREQRFLNGGRIQSAIGAPRQTTPYNCFVSGTIKDSMSGIMKAAAEAAETLRLGGGIGYDFSTLRPRGAIIKSLDSKSSGPLSFMGVFDALCKTISSAGHRRGAQMGVLMVWHPDVEEFITAKANHTNLTQFNISVGITNEFMEAVKNDGNFDLRWGGVVYKTVKARYLWDLILRYTWDWADPGVLFIDRINKKNNLWYCEVIAATNPCGEQPLPPYGACLLGSFNLTKYVYWDHYASTYKFNYLLLQHDIPHVVRALDNVIDRAIYPLPEQEKEAKLKRRMGIGVTGLANAMEVLGYPYGSEGGKWFVKTIMKLLRDTAYKTSIALSVEKGPFPLFDVKLLESDFAKTLPEDIREDIRKYGIRNSHLLSIAPTGSISISADNVSSGIEPVFAHSYERVYQTFDGPRTELVEDYGYKFWGVKGRTANEISVFEHVDMLNLVSYYVDSACSKTCNVGSDVTWDEFKQVYMKAYEGGASGCTTFRIDGKRFALLTEKKEDKVEAKPALVNEEEQAEFKFEEGGACYVDPMTGKKTCD